MDNFFGRMGLDLGNSIGHSIGQSLGGSIGQSLNSATLAPEELRIGSHNIVVSHKLAEGGFGVIELVAEAHTHREMVLKRCNVDREEVFNIVKKEISILQRFKGPYIVNLIESDVIYKNRTTREALILLDYCPGGHLLQRLNERQGAFLNSESIYRIFGQILLAVKPFHEHNPIIVHRDLKLENILFGVDGKVQLCDFGSCLELPILIRNVDERTKAEESIQKETTQMYRAPEMCNLYMRDQLTEKTDVWALGCIFYAIAFLKHPFQDMGSLGILAGRVNIPKDSPVSEDAHILLKRMLDIDPEARPSVVELLQAMREIARGNPLPPYQLSEEALRRRQERLAADEVRHKQTKKKPVQDSLLGQHSQKAAAPASNSVAAKRLAAKRGMAIDSFTSPTAAKNVNVPLFEARFDAFVSDSQPQQQSPQQHSKQQQRIEEEKDDLPIYHAPAATSGQRLQTANDLFDNDDGGDDNAACKADFFAPAPTSPVAAAAASGASVSKVVAEFDPFGQQSVPVAAASAQKDEDFCAFASDLPPALPVAAAPPAMPTRRAVTAPTPKQPAPESLFAKFDDDDDTPPSQPVHASTNNSHYEAQQHCSNNTGFDLFDDDPSPPVTTTNHFFPSSSRASSTRPSNVESLLEDAEFDQLPSARSSMAGRESLSASTVDFLPPVEVLKPQRPPRRVSQRDLLDTDDLISTTSPPTQISQQQGTPQRGGGMAMDLLSLYDAPKPEPPPKPVMLIRGSSMQPMVAPMMAVPMMVPQQMPMTGMGMSSAGPLGRGRPLTGVPPQQQQQQQQQSMMMGASPRPPFGINTSSNVSSGSNVYRGTGVISSAPSSARGGKPADPFASLYQSAKK